jgi:hypothetical protein
MATVPPPVTPEGCAEADHQFAPLSVENAAELTVELPLPTRTTSFGFASA